MPGHCNIQASPNGLVKVLGLSDNRCVLDCTKKSNLKIKIKTTTEGRTLKCECLGQNNMSTQLKLVMTWYCLNFNTGTVHVESSKSPLNSISLLKGNKYKNQKANTKSPFLQTPRLKRGSDIGAITESLLQYHFYLLIFWSLIVAVAFAWECSNSATYQTHISKNLRV